MGVSKHLRIDLADYDSQIRTFIPSYQSMVAVAGEAVCLVERSAPTIVDLGVGTGALSVAALETRPDAEVYGIDSDPGMLKAAEARLAGYPRVKLLEADFLEADLPPCDAIVACLSLHHIRRQKEKRDFYLKCRNVLRPPGVLVSADCFPGAEPALAAEHREEWVTHLSRSYSRTEAEAHLASWAEEDVYFPLETELNWLREAGFMPEVLWRESGFAVIAAFAPGEKGR